MVRSYREYLKDIQYPILILVAPSGAGKSTLAQELISLNPVFELACSYTTRQLNAEEKQKKLYKHVSERRFLSLQEAGFFLESNYFTGSHRYYGTPKSELRRIFAAGKIPILDIDINGLEQINKIISPYFTYRLYLYVTSEEQERRLKRRNREGDAEKLQSRLAAGIRENNRMQELSAKDPSFFTEIKEYDSVNVPFYANQLANDLKMYFQKKETWRGRHCGYGDTTTCCPHLLVGTLPDKPPFLCAKKVGYPKGFFPVKYAKGVIECGGYNITSMDESLQKMANANRLVEMKCS